MVVCPHPRLAASVVGANGKMKGLRRLLGTSTNTATWAVPVRVTRASPSAAGDKSPRLRLMYQVWQEKNAGAKSQSLKPRDSDCKPKKRSKNGALSVRQKKNENASLKRSGGLKRLGNNEIRSSAV